MGQYLEIYGNTISSLSLARGVLELIVSQVHSEVTIYL